MVARRFRSPLLRLVPVQLTSLEAVELLSSQPITPAVPETGEAEHHLPVLLLIPRARSPLQPHTAQDGGSKNPFN